MVSMNWELARLDNPGEFSFFVQQLEFDSRPRAFRKSKN
jgi:hypothetical protein